MIYGYFDELSYPYCKEMFREQKYLLLKAKNIFPAISPHMNVIIHAFNLGILIYCN